MERKNDFDVSEYLRREEARSDIRREKGTRVEVGHHVRFGIELSGPEMIVWDESSEREIHEDLSTDDLRRMQEWIERALRWMEV